MSMDAVEKKPSFGDILQECAKWGLLLGAILAGIYIYFAIGSVFLPGALWQLLILSSFVVCIIIGMFSARKRLYGGYTRYGKMLQVGVIIGVMAGIVGYLGCFVATQFIDPTYISSQNETVYKKLEEVANQVEASGQALPTIIDTQLARMEDKIQNPQSPIIYAGSQFISNVLTGIFVSLILAIFTKRKRPTIEVT